MPAIDIDKAKLEPSRFFKTPGDILKCDELTNDQKIEILKSWKYDVLDEQVAGEENMPCPNENSDKLLDDILAALRELGATSGAHHGSPTKHGDI